MSIGWYVHHHGAGHRVRLEAVARELPGLVALSSLPEPASRPCPWVTLALDVPPGAPEDPTAGATLHWAPLHHAGLRSRMAAISAWIERERPRALVVDVSVEVALIARLHGVPVVWIAQRGRRDDAPHALAYAQAAAIAAPWTEAAHVPGDGLPEERLHLVGAISRSGAVPAAPSDDVLLLLGAGGHEVTEADVAAAATASGRRWHVAGALRVTAPGVVDHGAGADVAALLARCRVVVASAGGNVVAEVAAARRPYVCLPQPRPFDEQGRQAEALARLGVAEVRTRWPPAADWPAVLAAAEARDTTRWAALEDGGGARRLAAVVRAVAAA